MWKPRKPNNTMPKKRCPHCNRYFHPAGMGAHLKQREAAGGVCPTANRNDRKRTPAKRKGRLDNWTLEDCEDMT